jgi:hypothetical protein
MPAASRANRARTPPSEHANANDGALRAHARAKKTKEVSGESQGKYRGVYRWKHGKYRAMINAEGKTYALGVFDDAEAAAMAFDRASIVLGRQPKNFATCNRYDLEWDELSKLDGDLRALRRMTNAGRRGKLNNMSVYRGVHRCSRSGRYRSEIEVDGKKFSLGVHVDEADAARAYDQATLVCHGEVAATTNFDKKEYDMAIINSYAGDLDRFRASMDIKIRRQGTSRSRCTSKHEGVRKYEHIWKSGKKTVKWRAEVKVGGKSKQLGYYRSEEEAAHAVKTFRFEHATVGA